MSRIDIETKRKLREMGVATLLDAFDAQDDTLTLGLAFEEKIKLAVDDAHSAFTQTKVEGLIRRANLRYPNADLRRLDLVEERGLDRSMIADWAPARSSTGSRTSCSKASPGRRNRIWDAR